MEDEKETKKTLAAVVRNYIFPKVKFTGDSDFDVEGVLFKKCRKHMEQKTGRVDRDSFKAFWKRGGWKVARSAIHSKRNNVQDSMRKYAIQCKQHFAKVSFLDCCSRVA